MKVLYKKLAFKGFAQAVLLIISCSLYAQQSVSIGDTNTKANAVLYLKGSGAQGLIIPLVTSNGAFGEKGMLVFNSTDNKLYYHNGTTWIEAAGGIVATELDGVVGNEVTQVNLTRGGLEVTGSGTVANPLTIGIIQGTTDGQVLKWNNTTKKWELGTVTGAGTDNQDLSLTGTTLSLTNDASTVTLGGLAILSAVGSSQITDGTIANVDISSSAAIAVTKLAPGTNGQILSTSAGVPTWVAGGADNQDLSLTGTTLSLTNDGTSVILGGLSILNAVGSTEITNGSIATADIAAGAITGGTTGVIADGTITNADIATSAAIAVTKLAPGTNGQILSTSAGVPTWVAGGADNQDLSLSGTTLSLTNDGTTVTLGGLSILGTVTTSEITDATITNADISSSAAIAVTKLAPGTNGQILSTSAGVPTWVAGGADNQDLSLSGTTLSLTNDGTSVTLGGLSILGAVSTSEITDATITNADISSSAAIAVTKLAPGTNGQVLSTSAGVPTWTTAGADSQDLSLSGTTLSLTNDGTTVTLGGLSILSAVGSTEITNGSIATADIAAGAITGGTTGVIADGTITNADISTSAAIAVSKLAAGTNGQVLSTTAGVPTWVAAGTDSQDLSLSGTTLSLTNDGTSVALGGLSILNTVGSTEIIDASIAAADIAAGAITGGPTGVIADGTITNADVSATAAIDGTKVNPNFGTQDITTTGKTILNSISYTWPATQSASTFLTNDGAGGLTWSAGGSALITNPGTNNLFAGVNSGTSNTGSNNAFFGASAGQANTSGINNTFIGSSSGQANTTGVENTFLGRNSGLVNVTGSYNVYLGKDAGNSMASGNLNTFVGYQAGHTANGVLASTYMGRLAGGNTTTGNYNTFIGEQSGLTNTTGSSNTFVGRNTGLTNTTGGTITLLGTGADVGSAALTNATAIGANATVSSSNTVVLGDAANVGIGTSNPGTSSLYVNVISGSTLASDGVTVVNGYNGASAKSGITNSVTLDGTGLRYGIENSVAGNSGSASAVYGISNLIAPNGTGSVYGNFSSISNVGTGVRVGNYNSVAVGATNTSSSYSSYSILGNAGSGTQYGNYNYLTNAGSGKKYANYNTVYGTTASASNIYGTYNSFFPNGSGDAFATFNFIRSSGTGNRYGTYDSVLATSTNTSAIYAMYAYTDHAGSGASYGVRVDANKPLSSSGSVYGIYNQTDNSGSGTTYGMYVDANKATGSAAVYGVYVTSDNDGTGNSYVVRGNSVGSTTGTEYGIYISGEDENYLAGALGVGRLPATNKLEVNGEASKSTAGSWIANSDKRIKTDIHKIENATETLMKLNPVMFHYTDYWKSKNPSIKDHYYYNFIAQEFKEVFPDAVQGSGEYLENDPNEILQIDTYNAEIVTIKAVQELIQRVEKLEKENAQLKADKLVVENELKAEITEIKKMLGLEASTTKKDK
jgi:hypothetical protein